MANTISNKKRFTTLCFTAVATIVLASCSSSNSNDNEPNENTAVDTSDATHIGFVNFETREQFGINTAPPTFEGIIDGGFFKLNFGFNPAILEDRTPAPETCTVRSDNFINESLEIFRSVQSVSAGDALVVSSPSGTFATIPVQTDDSGASYDSQPNENPIELPPLPDGLTLDISGAEFPAFANVSIPDLGRVINFDYPSDDIDDSIFSATTPFTWTPAGTPNSVIVMSAEAQTGETETTFFTCIVADDGSFTFPTTLTDEIGMFERAQFNDVTNQVTTILKSGTAVLNVRRINEIIPN